MSAAIDTFLYQRGWNERGFNTSIKVDDNILDSPTHKVDCYKNGVALEIEWNNKDPFFDRDLNNFRLPFANRTGKVAPEHKRLNRYDTISLKEIKDIPIAKIAADQSHLYLWVPNALIPEGWRS